MVDQNVIEEFIDAVKQEPVEKANVYSAEVSRIDSEGTVWVYIAGSDTETPTAMSAAEVEKGDMVNVEWRNNKLYIAGNTSNPSAGRSRVLAAERAAQVANAAAGNAVRDAGVAREAAEAAQISATDAKTTADSVRGIAVDAQTNAGIARSAADSAMKGLGQVEDVVGVLDWITAHSKVTTDTTPQAGKSYYIKNQDNTFTLVTDVTGKNPSQEGWYELTEAVQNYILSHLALTNDGLYVMKDNSHWKVRIADDGVYIIDPNENEIAKYKDEITLGNDNGLESYLKEDYHSIQLISAEGAAIINQSTDFDPSSRYSIGDYVKYNGNYYCCERAITTPSAWNPNFWSLTQVQYFWVSDLRDKDGYLTLTESFESEGETDYKLLYNGIYSKGLTVTVNGVAVQNYAWVSENRIRITPAPSSGAIISITYTTHDSSAKALTFGSRTNGNVGPLSVSFGERNIASGWCSFAFGEEVKSIGNYSHAEGSRTTAKGKFSHAEGSSSEALGNCSHVEGFNCTTEIYATCAHAEGHGTTARKEYSHAEGGGTDAIGTCSHAEGFTSTSSGDYSHSEGINTTASGAYSHSEGGNTTASGSGAHAEGTGSIASGGWSHAQNYKTVAGYEAQTTIGKYNDNQQGTAFEIGNGRDDDNRSNAFEVDWSGNVNASGDIEDGQGNILADKLDSNGIFDLIYPVGSYYWTSDGNFVPDNVFGGRWEKIDAGVTLVSAGTGYTVTSGTAKDGGSEDSIIPYHRHSVSEQNTGNMSANSSHNHDFSYAQYTRGTGSATASALQYTGSTKTTSTESVQHTHKVPSHNTNYVGTSGNTTGANMPPYKCAYCWHRTA